MKTIDLTNPTGRQYAGQRISHNLSEIYQLRPGESWAWLPGSTGSIIVVHPGRLPKIVAASGEEAELILPAAPATRR